MNSTITAGPGGIDQSLRSLEFWAAHRRKVHHPQRPGTTGTPTFLRYQARPRDFRYAGGFRRPASGRSHGIAEHVRRRHTDHRGHQELRCMRESRHKSVAGGFSSSRLVRPRMLLPPRRYGKAPDRPAGERTWNRGHHAAASPGPPADVRQRIKKPTARNVHDRRHSLSWHRLQFAERLMHLRGLPRPRTLNQKPSPPELQDGATGVGVLSRYRRRRSALRAQMIQVFTSPCECGWPGLRFRSSAEAMTC